MKKFLLISIVLLGVFFPVHINADENSFPFIKKKKDPLNRPKAPSRQIISGSISGEYLTIFFLLDEGDYTLTVTDNNGVVTEHTNLDSSVPTQVYIGNLESATFEIQTSAGNTYVAEI